MRGILMKTALMVYSDRDFKIKALPPSVDGFDSAAVERYPSGSGAPPFDNLNVGGRWRKEPQVGIKRDSLTGT